MKRTILQTILTLLLYASTCGIYAQTADDFCGDWVGTYTIPLPDPNSDGMRDEQIKMCIRINKTEDKFTVRIKTLSRGEYTYFPTCENVTRQGNRLSFTMNMGDDYDWNGTRHKGRTIKKASYTMFSSISMNSGTLYYTDYMRTIYYDSNYVYIDENKTNTLRSLTMYRDDGW